MLKSIYSILESLETNPAKTSENSGNNISLLMKFVLNYGIRFPYFQELHILVTACSEEDGKHSELQKTLGVSPMQLLMKVKDHVKSS